MRYQCAGHGIQAFVEGRVVRGQVVYQIRPVDADVAAEEGRQDRGAEAAAKLASQAEQ